MKMQNIQSKTSLC